jgi:DNA invertase Pin-like site-specific DNA recombinase
MRTNKPYRQRNKGYYSPIQIKTTQTPRQFCSDRVLRAALAPGAYSKLREEANNRPQVPSRAKMAWWLSSNKRGEHMANTKYAYVRVSSTDQNEDRQLDAMTAFGIPPERIFTDKQSGKDMNRPQLQCLLETVERGDAIIVESVSRLARNTRDLLELVERLAAKGVDFISQKENIDTATPTGKFMLTVFGAVAELERGYIKQRQAEGIVAANRRGVHMGRPAKNPPNGFAAIVKAWERGEIPLSKALADCGGISRSTFFRRLGEYRCGRRSRR